MLPYLKKDRAPGLIVQTRKPDENTEQSDDSMAGLHAAAAEIIRAMELKDAKSLAAAFHNAFQICESMPHEEAESDEAPESMEE